MIISTSSLRLPRPVSRLVVNFKAGLAFSRLILGLAAIFAAVAAYHLRGGLAGLAAA